MCLWSVQQTEYSDMKLHGLDNFKTPQSIQFSSVQFSSVQVSSVGIAPEEGWLFLCYSSLATPVAFK
jgi:hypothetical protein